MIRASGVLVRSRIQATKAPMTKATIVEARAKLNVFQLMRPNAGLPNARA